MSTCLLTPAQVHADEHSRCVQMVRTWCRKDDTRFTVLGTLSGSVYVIMVTPQGAWLEQLIGDTLALMAAKAGASVRRLPVTSIRNVAPWGTPRLQIVVEHHGTPITLLLSRIQHDTTV